MRNANRKFRAPGLRQAAGAVESLCATIDFPWKCTNSHSIPAQLGGRLLQRRQIGLGDRPTPRIQGTRILFAGNIGTSQSFETIIEAAQLLKHRPDIHWIIVGDGLMRNWLEQQIRSCELSSTVALLG
jgi:glycosyltransferase involved in cell wall biosynthesis